MPAASALVPLWDRAAEWQRRLAMIRDARTFLYLSTFYVEYDDYAIELLEALGAAQRRGVAVNLLIDTFGQRLGNVLMSGADRTALAAAFNTIRTAGGIVTMYRPSRLAQRWLGCGQHVKIQVSDAGEALFASSNITRVSFEGWNEYAVAVRGPIVRTLLESYRHIGGLVDAAHLKQLPVDVVDPAALCELEYWFCNPNQQQGVFGPIGWRGTNAVTDQLVAMIETARTSIRITSFYFKPVEVLMAALLRAAARGVAIEVFHSHRDALPATDLAWIAAATHYDQLLAAGVIVYERLRGEHSKIVVVDDAWAAFGSYNFEDAAHDRLAEAMLATRDPAGVVPAVAIFDLLRQDPDNVRVTAESFGNLTAGLKTRIARYGRFKRWM